MDRPKAQEAIFSHATKRPTVHALGNEDARLLSSHFGIAMPPTVYWTEKACRETGNVRVIDKEEILAQSPTQTKQAKDPFRWKTTVRHQGHAHYISIVPDYVFGLEYIDKPEGKNRVFFFVEIDRATMPVVRRDIMQTSFLRKMQSYEDTWNRKLAERQFGMKTFRVLTLTTSSDRIGTMIEAYRSELEERVPGGIFLFRPKHLGLDKFAGWKNAAGKTIKLLQEYS